MLYKIRKRTVKKKEKLKERIGLLFEQYLYDYKELVLNNAVVSMFNSEDEEYLYENTDYYLTVVNGEENNFLELDTHESILKERFVKELVGLIEEFKK